jgi:hypothetical protein
MVRRQSVAHLDDPILSCDSWQGVPGAYNAIRPSLPTEVRQQMTKIMFSYFARFGPQGVFERFNNRTISRILAEFDGGEGNRIESGEIDGVRYELYERPDVERNAPDQGA